MNHQDDDESFRLSTGIYVNTISSILSFMGSACVIHLSCRKTDEMYHRILFFLSISDLFASVVVGLFPFLSNGDEPWEIGTDTSCKISGLMNATVPAIAQVFNFYLALYFFMSVVHNWSDWRFRKHVEKTFLAVWSAYFVLMGGVALGLDAIHPYPISTICYINRSENMCDPDDSLCQDEYKNAAKRSNYVLLTHVAVNGGITIASFVFTFLVFRCVQRQFRRIKQLTLNADSISFKQRQTAQQFILFTGVYLNSTIWPYLGFLWVEIGGRENAHNTQDQLPLSLVIAITYVFLPLQGFLNFGIYVRPHLAAWSKACPKLWWHQRLIRTLRLESPPEPRKVEQTRASDQTETTHQHRPSLPWDDSSIWTSELFHETDADRNSKPSNENERKEVRGVERCDSQCQELELTEAHGKVGDEVIKCLRSSARFCGDASMDEFRSTVS